MRQVENISYAMDIIKIYNNFTIFSNYIYIYIYIAVNKFANIVKGEWEKLKI